LALRSSLALALEKLTQIAPPGKDKDAASLDLYRRADFEMIEKWVRKRFLTETD